MIPSVEVAKSFYVSNVLPRCTRDPKTEKVISERNDSKPRIFRKARPGEDGELFPYFDFNFRFLAQFGLGIGVYFIQLLVIASLSFIAGCIMIPAIIEYRSDTYGIESEDPRVAGTAACSLPTNETASVGCPGGALNCSVSYRADCTLNATPIITDMVMVVFLLIILYLNMFTDDVEDYLDEIVQTTQDYSIVVQDPPENASRMGEWYTFFRRFGRVCYITITRKNKTITKLLLQKHLCLRNIRAFGLKDLRENDIKPAIPLSCWEAMLQPLGYLRNQNFWLNQLYRVNAAIEDACKEKYAVSKVYVSFESEEEQRHCLKELGVSALTSFFNIGASMKTRNQFRNAEILHVCESAEPNNILWANIEIHFLDKIFRRLIANGLCAVVMYGSYSFITYVLHTRPMLTPLAISWIDSMLPALFIYISYVESHVDEDDRQNSLLLKLFVAKLLTSVIFNYVNLSWSEFLDPAEVTRILNIQLSSCFITPLIKAMDLYGLFCRHVVSRCQSSQPKMNMWWTGSEFTLADRYTEVSKIVFIALFYSLLVPTALFIATLACLVVFFVDRYLLLRKTRTPPMLDASLASTIRKQLLFAIGCHLYVSCRLIYSWPMDEAFRNSNNELQRVSKDPPYLLFNMHHQEWHNDTQDTYLPVYKFFAVILIITILVAIFFEPVCKFIYTFFFNASNVETSASGIIGFSQVENIQAYVPIIGIGKEKFIVADTDYMLARHKPEITQFYPDEDVNLAYMIPPEHRKNVLATVKWFGDIEESVEEKDAVDVGFGDMPEGPPAKSTSNRKPLLASSQSSIARNREANAIEVTAAPRKPKESVVPAVAPAESIDVVSTPSSLIPDRSLENYRLQRAISQRKQNKVAVMPPPMTERSPTNSAAATRLDHETFQRDEVLLLRQLRKEFLKVSPEKPLRGLATKDTEQKKKSMQYVSFTEYCSRISDIAPGVVLMSDQTSRTKWRPILRRIFVKFMDIQRASSSASDIPEGYIDWALFTAFVQNGVAVALTRMGDGAATEKI